MQPWQILFYLSIFFNFFWKQVIFDKIAVRCPGFYDVVYRKRQIWSFRDSNPFLLWLKPFKPCVCVMAQLHCPAPVTDRLRPLHQYSNTPPWGQIEYFWIWILILNKSSWPLLRPPHLPHNPTHQYTLAPQWFDPKSRADHISQFILFHLFPLDSHWSMFATTQ